ncbi:uncharacterized protein TRUGW13939_02453 [Talaromyces rugulosus]|uniref:NmrA-like domain-containing protein n=1 Tax=Talaromyces rugulosus TaxID=121627 RepID=A0A7H8QPG3_TALRU|nr:uncharacterized protein TRUGW13939_02453 [Talaromyces rugulosus]QKX55361.1 hypothetical protein TRUGW13939_02453 [Talaromyces rugulosus]
MSAIGNQGGGVVRALLGSGLTGGNLWLIRTLTRDPNLANAKNLLAAHQTIDNCLTLVTGHALGITADDMAKTFTRVTGEAAVHEPISAEEFAELAVPFVGPAFKEDAKEMMEWAAVMPADKICYSAFDADQDHSVQNLGLSATSFKSWLYRTS